ncbi:sensor domain-containing diguanylate cyclase [Aeromonas enteropelogenes]|uniref:sensor domain-containing diguanylate cyclase n=1 Tax=Aeromonas enteropelogenes TaxID=29489 RepID=UPI003BA00E6E
MFLSTLFDRRFFSPFTWPLLALAALLIILALRQSLKQIEDVYQSDTLNSAIHLRDQFRQSQVFLEAMHGQAEERLRSTPQSALTRQLYHHIEALPDQGLALDHRPLELPRKLVGNLTGAGPLPPPGSKREARLHLALSLSPLLSTASREFDNEIAWVYFTGVDHFIYLYPWVPSSRFRFSPSLYQSTYWQDALAAHNPERGTIISRPFNDLAGTGQLITLSRPLYQDGHLVGMLSMDIQLSRLHQQLDELIPELGDYMLVNQYRQVLASSAANAVAPADLIPSSTYLWQQGTLRLILAIPDTPLRLIHTISLWPLLQAMICQSGPTLLAILFMLLAALSNLRARRLNQRLNYLSCHDNLTGAFNRHYLAQLEQQNTLTPAQQTGFLMFDADHFKRVNDTFGHGVGDAVLIRLVRLCQGQLRREDCLIRWGGEEFLVLIAQSDGALLAEVAERLRAVVAGHDWGAIAPGLAVTISLGHHACCEDIPHHEAVRRADVALYQAKANGRNRSERWQSDACEHTG